MLSFWLLSGNSSFVLADTSSDIETIFNWAENHYPQLFVDHQVTQSVEPWRFRYYPATDIYVGMKDNEIFVLGGPWGHEHPTFIETTANLLNHISVTGENGSIAGCNTNDIPAGMVFSQNGDVVQITTNGQCIALPDDGNSNLCAAPSSPAKTGISVLGSNRMTSSEIKGISIDMPGIPNPAGALQDSFAGTYCTMNAPEQTANLIVNMNVCYDITTQFESFQNIPGMITINPPVTFSFVGTATSQVVGDCFATDAAAIFDAFTEESWFRQADGSFAQIR